MNFEALIAQGVLIAVILLQMWQNQRLSNNLSRAVINCLHLSGRLSASLSIAKVFMQYLSDAETNGKAGMALTEDAVNEMHRAYFYAVNGQPMTEDCDEPATHTA